MESHLERRYRRMLAWYPWDHRRRYEDEMVETLVAGSAPGQLRPDIRDTADLARRALGAHLRQATRELADPRWAAACAVTGLLAAIATVALRVRPIAVHVALDASGYPFILLSTGTIAQFACWLVVVAVVLAGFRILAAALAWFAVAVDLAVNAYVHAGPAEHLHSLWMVVVGVVAAAALSVPAAGHAGVHLLGRRRLMAVLLGCAAGVAGSAAGVVLFPRLGGGGSDLLPFLPVRLNVASFAGAVAAVVLVAGAVATLDGGIRRRIAALSTPLPAVFALGHFGYPNASYPTFESGAEPVRWVVVVLTIAVALAGAVLLVQRHEQRERLIELGRAVDRGL